MRRFYTTIAAAALLALPGMVLAATPQEKTAGKAQPQAEKAVTNEPSSMGSIEKFDAASKMLTLKTSKGESSFVLGSDCTIAEGAKTLPESDLASMVGHPVKVYYTGAPGGTKSAHKIVVEHEKSAKPSKMAAGTTAPQSPKK
jgi:hypothetical protein